MTTPHYAFNTMEVRSWNQPQSKNEKVFGTSSNPTSFPIGLTWLDIDKSANIRINAFTDSDSQDSMIVHLNAWADTILYSAGCTWLEVSAEDNDFQFGKFSTRDDHPPDKPQMQTSRKITFPKRFHDDPPKIVVWLNQLDMANSTNWRCNAYATDITHDEFIIHIDTWSNTWLYSGTASWIAYPSNHPRITSGSFNTMEVRAWYNPHVTNKGKARFDKTFQSRPSVFAAINFLDIGNTGNLRLKLATSNVTVDGLTWDLDAWGDTILYSAGASYIAIQDS